MSATVRCEDGVCYPCIILGIALDYQATLPKYEIKFTDKRPDFVILNKIIVSRDRISFDDQESFTKLIEAARRININAPVIRRSS